MFYLSVWYVAFAMNGLIIFHEVLDILSHHVDYASISIAMVQDTYCWLHLV